MPDTAQQRSENEAGTLTRTRLERTHWIDRLLLTIS